MSQFSPHNRKSLFVIPLMTWFLATAFQEPQTSGGISPLIWVLIILILILVLVWLLSRAARQSNTPPPPMSTEPTVESITPSEPVMVPAPDDLVIIEGIGPKIASLLNAAGITTFAQLAAADVNHLRQLLRDAGLPMSDPSSWMEQARLAAAGDMAGLQALQDRLKGGRQV